VDNSFLIFLGISILVIVTPGPDTALTIRNIILGERVAGVATAFGVSTGQLIWAAATSIGLVALLLASEPVFQAVKMAGAVYLIYLGMKTLISAFSLKRVEPATETGSTRKQLRPLIAYGQGIINDLGNPKMAVFFASVLPQFAPQGQGMLSALVLLGLVFAALTFLWLSFYAYALSAAGAFLQQSRIRRTIEGFMGAVLVGLGIRIATESQ
jgi:threonine/homoserine/homoserine lactone efflux protein